jgi:hypothetical protein
MITYHPIELPPQLQAAMTPVAHPYASMIRQQAEQRRYQALLNESIAQQLRAAIESAQTAQELAKQGRYC